MNEPVQVKLGIWPIFGFLFGTPAVAATATTAAVAATTGFLTYAGIAAATLLTADSIIKSFDRPRGITSSVEGIAAIRGISPEVVRELERQQIELERLHQEELQKAEEQKLRQQFPQKLLKYGLITAGAVGLVAIILARRRK